MGVDPDACGSVTVSVCDPTTTSTLQGMSFTFAICFPLAKLGGSWPALKSALSRERFFTFRELTAPAPRSPVLTPPAAILAETTAFLFS
jgi:hypothetical protein